ncbi:MAG TPA: hypothetical protein VKU88_00480 [Acidimicrobiales bacterium]|nr:hypothetical protein [Acidimicrobiales bacterium]
MSLIMGVLGRILAWGVAALLAAGAVASVTLPAAALPAIGTGRVLPASALRALLGSTPALPARSALTRTAPPSRPAASAPSAMTGGGPPPAPTPSGNGGAPGYGCAAAIEWLTYHAAPGFSFVCPGNGLGGQAFTCQNVPGVCPNNERLIVIADPCPAAYKNEAWNSWVVEGLVDGPYDPFGWCPT